MRLAKKGHWGFKMQSEPAADVNDAARAILSRLPPRESWEVLRRETELSMTFHFARTGLAGFVELDSEIVTEVAQLGVTLGFFNYGA